MSNPNGRPSDYTDEKADAICERIVAGESMRAICADPDMPAISTVFRWLSLNAQFSEQYARAKEEQAEAFADEIVRIADKDVPNEDTAVLTARDRLRVDARKWVASKLKPKKYGDKVQTELTGANGGPVETVTRIKLADLEG